MAIMCLLFKRLCHDKAFVLIPSTHPFISFPACIVVSRYQRPTVQSTNIQFMATQNGSVSIPEVMECMFLNAIAPIVLNSCLKPLMEAPAGDPNKPDRYTYHHVSSN